MIYLHWHAWQSIPSKKWLLSDERTKKLRQFDDFDTMINWLYLNGHKDAARHFNKLKK